MEKFLLIDGVVLLFHLDDPQVLKEIKSYLETYSFQICMKWVVVNSLPFVSLEDPSLKVWAPICSSFLYIHFLASFFQILYFGMLQTFLS